MKLLTNREKHKIRGRKLATSHEKSIRNKKRKEIKIKPKRYEKGILKRGIKEKRRGEKMG